MCNIYFIYVALVKVIKIATSRIDDPFGFEHPSLAMSWTRHDSRFNVRWMNGQYLHLSTHE